MGLLNCLKKKWNELKEIHFILKRTAILNNCSKVEFDEFIAGYSGKLDKYAVMEIDTPIMVFYEYPCLLNGEWPNCIVASYSICGGDKNDQPAPIPCNWKILSSR